MNAVWSITRKEIRSLFLSPVALMFVGVFLLMNLLTFFILSGFFARNLADVRPLFQWMPLLLIVLSAAVTMRQWSEEKSTRTIELLLTLPIQNWQFVTGKFFACFLLLSTALVLTFPIPLTVAFLGDLQWGPVVGGYFGALLLGSTYLAVGLFISSVTRIQVVALILTLLVGGLLYLPGVEGLLRLFHYETADFLKSLGTGSRFSSIERGVLDLRDFLYYGSLTVFFLALNTAVVGWNRLDAKLNSAKLKTSVISLLLILGNLVVLNLWIAPLPWFRFDTTGMYSIHPATKQILSELTEPLHIQGIFSSKTHPKLSPLIPQLHDLLKEYEVYGKGKISVELLDPSANTELEEELSERYGIQSVPVPVASHNEQSLINLYFHVLIQYGDKHESLSFDKLIETKIENEELSVGLKNPEYDITRSIKRVSQEFRTIDSILASASSPVKATVYMSENVPEALKPAQEALLVSLEEFAKTGSFSFEKVDPLKDTSMMEALKQKGIMPMIADLFNQEYYYFSVLVESSGKSAVFRPAGSEAEIKNVLESSIKRVVPGNLKTIGIYTKIRFRLQKSFNFSF